MSSQQNTNIATKISGNDDEMSTQVTDRLEQFDLNELSQLYSLSVDSATSRRFQLFNELDEDSTKFKEIFGDNNKIKVKKMESLRLIYKQAKKFK